MICRWLAFFVAVSPLWADDFHPDQSQLPATPPEGAIVLFDGSEESRFLSMSGRTIDWTVDNGSLVSTKATKPQSPRSNHIVSAVRFRDADLHVEFMLPQRGPGNSGIYIHGHYELQIIASEGKADVSQQDAGAVYGFAPPLVNACRPRGQWQVYDLRYRAPRRNGDGTILEQGSITAWLNGQLVQKDLRVGDPRSSYHPFRYGATPYLKEIEQQMLATSIGPVFLQDHDSAVRFRNVWIKPLDDQTRVDETVAN